MIDYKEYYMKYLDIKLTDENIKKIIDICTDLKICVDDLPNNNIAIDEEMTQRIMSKVIRKAGIKEEK